MFSCPLPATPRGDFKMKRLIAIVFFVAALAMSVFAQNQKTVGKSEEEKGFSFIRYRHPASIHKGAEG